MSPAGLLAIPLGALVGFLARRLGRKGTRPALLAGAVAALALLAAHGLAAAGPLRDGLRARADRVGREEYDRFARAAAAWAGHRGDDGKFAQAWELLPGSPLDRPGPRVAEFRRTVVPELEAWRKGAPPFGEWRERRRAAILAEGDAPWAAFFASPLRFVSFLDLLATVLGVAAAVRLAYVPAPAVIRRRAADPSSPGTPGPI